MANRRFGGGPQRGGRPFPQQQYQGNNVSPWQGGVAPNNSGGLLSQLSAPQQIALALTSLLQPQQQQGNSNPPSLLSLNTSPFSNQDHFGNQSRFNRGHSDFRRLEPYNKAPRGNNWRAETNRPRPGGNANFNRNRNINKDHRRKSPPRDSRPPYVDKSPVKPVEKKPEESDKDSSVLKLDETIDLSVDEGRDDEGHQKKRDWKEEKNIADEKEDEDVEHKPADVPATPDEEKKDAGKREGRYYGVPPGLLHCFVCNKSMWDGESFQNHIRGKAHKQMLQSLEESFQITVNILRENMRLVEEKKMIELNRMHRNNRNYSRKMNEPQSTCNMCDLKFMGKIIVHRKTEGHQRLKRFLHPNCDVCNQEFPSRMEWVEHRFTPEHLRKLKEVNEGKLGGEDGAIIEENLEIDLEPLLDEPLQTEGYNPVLELSEDLSNFQNRIPAYRKTRPISTESLKPAAGFMCELCNRFFYNEALSQAHLKSERHYIAFVEAAKNKCKRVASEKAEEEEGNWKRPKVDESVNEEEVTNPETSVNGGGNEMYDPEEACNESAETEAVEDSSAKEEAHEDEKWMEIDSKLVEEEAEVKMDTIIGGDINDVPEEEVKAPVVSSPRTRRGGAVKNGAGPKSRKMMMRK